MQSIFFLHIPKTAGTTITSIIEDNYSTLAMLSLRRIRELFSASRYVDGQDIAGAQAIAGHLPLSLSNYMTQPVSRVVFLRDPVSLVLSTFEHHKRSGDIGPTEQLEEILESSDGNFFSNIQTRWIAEQNVPGIAQMRGSINCKFGLQPEGFEQAILNLEKMDFVGITERMQESTDLFCKYFKFSSTDPHLALNVGDYARKVSKKVISLIQERNAYDIALYKRGMEIFESQLRPEWIEGLGCEIDRPLKWRTFLDMDDHVSHVGLHRRELWPDWGGARWTNEESFINLECAVQTNIDYVFKMFVLGAVTPSEISRLSVRINGKKLELSIKTEYSSFRISAVFRTEKEWVQPTVEICAPFAIRPCDIEGNGAGDKRMLGVAIKWIYVGPNDDFLEAKS